LVLIANQVTNDPLDIEWVAAQDPPFEPLVAQRLDGLLLPFERRFADASQSAIGGQPQE